MYGRAAAQCTSCEAANILLRRRVLYDEGRSELLQNAQRRPEQPTKSYYDYNYTLLQQHCTGTSEHHRAPVSEGQPPPSLGGDPASQLLHLQPNLYAGTRTTACWAFKDEALKAVPKGKRPKRGGSAVHGRLDAGVLGSDA